jgi:hypothetical protein
MRKKGCKGLPVTSLEKDFDKAMFDIYRRADAEVGYRPTIFLNMLHDRGGILTAKQLINAPMGTRASMRPGGSI